VAAVARLINILTARGEDLKAGSVALSGGLVCPVPVRPWGVVSAEFDGLGAIEVYA
jgi:2-keto-4-pentenoate hydratase